MGASAMRDTPGTRAPRVPKRTRYVFAKVFPNVFPNTGALSFQTYSQKRSRA
jgi:hypothetical protein